MRVRARTLGLLGNRGFGVTLWVPIAVRLANGRVGSAYRGLNRGVVGRVALAYLGTNRSALIDR